MDEMIYSFIDSVIKYKKLKFSVDEIKIDSKLLNENILKIEKDIIVISNYEVISKQFLEIYKRKFDFTVSKSFQQNIEFIKNIEKDFKSNGYVQDYHILEKEIWKCIINESNLKFKCSFNDYLTSIDLENKPDEIFNFIEAYSNLLSDLDLTVDVIFQNALLLMEITKSDTSFNLDLASILKSIKNKCSSDYELGLEMLHKSLTLNEDKENIISAIVAGLYDNKKVDFYNSILSKLIKKESKLNPILFGLSNVSKIENAECELFIDLIKNLDNNDLLIISKLSLVFSILKSDNPTYYSYCFNELETAIENEKTAYYILTNLSQLNNYEEKITDVIVKLINQDYFETEKYINAITRNFWNLKEFQSFKKVVFSIIENRPFANFTKNFQSYFHLVDKFELDKFVIELLTDNKARKRATGLEIFNKLSNHTPVQFSFNIIKLSPITQYKLWVSLTQDFHEPKNIIIALLPLIHSKSELVKESFLCKLEEISEDYGGLVTEILKDNLSNDNSDNVLAIERIKNYYETYYEKNANLKNSISELNPYQTQYKHLKRFNNLFHKNMSQSINKGARENSFLSILGTNTTQLSKGGGFRFGQNNEISQLGTFSSSFNLPRNYFIDPNKYELEIASLIKKDWTDEEFSEIKNLLDNE